MDSGGIVVMSMVVVYRAIFLRKKRSFATPPSSSSDGHMITPFHHQTSTSTFPMMQSSPSSSSPALPGTFNISKDGTAYDLGELDQALFLYLDGQDHHSPQEQRQGSGVRPHTLNIFPSQPMHVEPSSSTAAPKGSSSSTGLVSPSASGSQQRSSQPSMPSSNPRNDVASPPQTAKVVKAYVQQLETCRMRLTQLEQEIQRARSQGFHLGGSALLAGEQGLQVAMATYIPVDAANLFDMEYARWLEEPPLDGGACNGGPFVGKRAPSLGGQLLALYDQVMNLKNDRQIRCFPPLVRHVDDSSRALLLVDRRFPPI
ncbi:UNVERIFIED_CONTAM: bZIP transcription factor TGA10 [Sesamum radiatum]|uniref:BZIP transcription factor TGA10 n=1 Tax=Sesamum radiatum TaxID=300843 RepID=A0AAW2JIW3_SESRA